MPRSNQKRRNNRKKNKGKQNNGKKNKGKKNKQQKNNQRKNANSATSKASKKSSRNKQNKKTAEKLPVKSHGFIGNKKTETKVEEQRNNNDSNKPQASSTFQLSNINNIMMYAVHTSNKNKSKTKTKNNDNSKINQNQNQKPKPKQDYTEIAEFIKIVETLLPFIGSEERVQLRKIRDNKFTLIADQIEQLVKSYKNSGQEISQINNTLGDCKTLVHEICDMMSHEV